MTQNEIIEITRQAGGFNATPEFLERFAEPVWAFEIVNDIRARGQA